MLKIILLIIFLYAGYCCFLFVIQRQFLFPRSLVQAPPISHIRIPGMERIWLNTSFGKVESWLLVPRKSSIAASFPVVIFAHGNGELIDFWPSELKRFNDFGLGVLLVEYPGYGRSRGSPSRKSIAETFIAAYDMLVSRPDADMKRILLLGRSIGGGAACDLAAERPSAAIILMSTFTTAKSFAPKFLVPGFLIRDPFDNLAVVRKYEHPVLIIHGKYDELIPYKHGKKLYQAAKNGKLIAYTSGHNDCPPDWDIFWRDIELFLKEIRII